MTVQQNLPRRVRRMLRLRRAHHRWFVFTGIGVALVVGGKGHLPGNAAVAALIRPAAAPGSGAAPAPGTAMRLPLMLSPSAARTEQEILHSTAVGADLPYLVFLPPGYDTEPRRSYPVLVLLHGLGGDETQWQRLGALGVAERLMRAGELPPMVIVMPRGEQGYWMNHAGGGPRWGDFVVEELLETVDTRYRTLADREHRAIGGISMGGHGALQLALNHPWLFTAAGGHSLVLRRHPEAPVSFGNAAYYAAHDPMSMVTRDPAAARSLKLWVDIGVDDPWAGRDLAFHALLNAAGVPHEWRLWSGGHNDAYWTAHLEDYLRFYGQTLAPSPAETMP